MVQRSNNNDASDVQTKSVKFNDVTVDGYKFSGYASVFGGLDAYGDTIEKGAFSKVIASGEMPKMFFNHNSWGIPIGKWTLIEEDDKGLRVEGELTQGNTEAEQIKAALAHGTIDGLSIGFSLAKDGYRYEKNTDVRTILEVEKLFEISIVTFPADSAARISEVKMSDIEAIKSVREFEKVLRDSGLSQKLAVAMCSKAKDVFNSQRESEEEIASVIKTRLDAILQKAEHLTSKE